MSNSCMYELDDIAWDEFDQFDDHIVPHASHENGSGVAFQEDSCNRPGHEVNGISSNAGDSSSTKYINQQDGDVLSLKKKRKILFQEQSCSHPSEVVLPALCDSGLSGEPTRLVSHSTRVPGSCLNSADIDTTGTKFCADDAMEGDMCSGNSCPYSFDNISQTENDLIFLDNDHEGWPDIENFGDVDRMFRSCDSTFGFGSSIEDDLSWLSSSQTIEESEDMLKSDFKVSCPELSPFEDKPEHDHFELNNASSSVNDSKLGSAYISNNSGFQTSEIGETDNLDNLSLIEVSGMSKGKGEFAPTEQPMKFQKQQASRPNPSEGKRKYQYKSSQLFVQPDLQKQKKNISPGPFSNLQTPAPYLHLNYKNPWDQISISSKPSGIKSEIRGLTSLSPKESSYASSQAHSIESRHHHPSGAPAVSGHNKQENLQRIQGFYPPLVLKQVHCQNEDEISGVERICATNPAERDPSNVPETSCMSSEFDEVSLETSSFRQFQLVIEQLDIRTKLCIRDSLYRLASSAERRHCYASMSGYGPSDGQSGNGLMAEGSNNGFMGMETETNPIDRCVAHLLFHRPLDPYVMPANDGSSMKLQTVIHGSNNSPSEMAEQLVCQEEAATDAEKKVPITGDG